MKKQLSYRYSGENSKDFWKQIDTLKGWRQKEMYALGCSLQQLEEFTLKRMEDNKKGSVKPSI